MKIKLQDITTQFVLPLWNQKALELIDLFVNPTAEIRTTFLKGLGPFALKQEVIQILNAFTSFEFTIQETVQQVNKCIYKWHGKATHTGLVLDVHPTEEKILFSGITSIEVQEGSITRYHSFSDLPRVFLSTKTFFQTTDLSSLFSSNIENIISTIKDLTGTRLTKREVECLRLWTKGCSIKETAKQLGGLSNRTIQTFRENIKRKLQADTYQQLLRIIQKSGILLIL